MGELPAVLTEDGLRVAEAATLLGVEPMTVRRWMSSGVPVGSRRVKLEGIRVGCKWRTSKQAVARFVAATTNPVKPEPITSPAELNRRAEKAKKQLRSLGVAC